MTHSNDDFTVDIDKALRDAERAEKRAEVDRTIAEWQLTKLDRDNREAAHNLGIITDEQYQALKDKTDTAQVKARLDEHLAHLDSLRRDRDGVLRDSQGNRYDNDGNYVY